MSPGDPAGIVQQALDEVAHSAGLRTGPPGTSALHRLPGTAVLGERAFHSGFEARAPWSCGGWTRAVRARDGWFVLCLARPEDRRTLPALTFGQCTPPGTGEGRPADDRLWAALESWTSTVDLAELHERSLLLGLPGRPVPAATGRSEDPGAHERPRRGVLSAPGGRRAVHERPLVVDLTGLWAGPLASRLLQLTGCRVVKVEGRRRPDGARGASRTFFDALHHGKQALTVDLDHPAELEALHALLSRADLVMESSRADAMARRGLDASALVSSGTSWLSITAEGRESRAVGFGDDVAMGAGLVAGEADAGGQPWPCGDALADPLTGVVAAAAASEALLDERARLIDVSMVDVCRDALGDGTVPEHRTVRRGEEWWVETATGLHPVLPPRGRTTSHAAPEFGAHDHLWEGIAAR